MKYVLKNALVIVMVLLLASCSYNVTEKEKSETQATASYNKAVTSGEIEPETALPEETAPTLPEKDFTELDGNLRFHRFDDGNAAVVWNDTDACIRFYD